MIFRLIKWRNVLKDASSTANLWCARCQWSNSCNYKGSKRRGKFLFSYNGYVKFNTPTKYLATLDPYDYLSFVWGNAAASGDAYRLPFEKLYGISDYSGSNTGGIESYRNTGNYNIQKMCIIVLYLITMICRLVEALKKQKFCLR